MKKTPKTEVFLHSSSARAAASRSNLQQDLAEELLAKRQAAGKLTELLLTNKKCDSFEKLRQLTTAKVNSLPEDLKDFYAKNLALSVQQSVMLSSQTATQSEEEWDAARHFRTTGARVYSLYTYTKNKKPNWHDKMKKVFNSSFSGTADTLYGLEQEPFAKTAYSSKCKVKATDNGIFVHPDLPWLGSSVDAVVVDDAESPLWMVEVKCLVAGKTKTASELPKLAECCDKTLKLKHNHKYYGQIQLGMFLLGLKRCDFILYSSFDETCVYETVLFNEKWTFDMLSSLVNVYFDIALPYFYEIS